jgi:hypothetical protein
VVVCIGDRERGPYRLREFDVSENQPIPDVSAFFQRLKEAATRLNTVSDELGKSITALDAVLKQLNLGVSTWVPIDGYENPETADFGTDLIGYAKVGSKWGIALKERRGNYNADIDEAEVWLFNEGPRALRIKAVAKLPELLEALTVKAAETAEEIKAQIGRAQEVVSAVATVADAGKPLAQRRK